MLQSWLFSNWTALLSQVHVYYMLWKWLMFANIGVALITHITHVRNMRKKKYLQ